MIDIQLNVTFSMVYLCVQTLFVLLSVDIVSASI